MYCPRLDHFVRLNPNDTVSRCGHMVTISPEFNNLEEMESSPWLATIKKEFADDQWPRECVRCQQTESENKSSIRLNAIEFDKLQKQEDYLSVGGVLDNLCNSACLTCNENLSTLIGGLKSKTYPIVDNSNKFWSLPLDRVVHLDINGGEPSHSKNYKHLLANLPKNIKSVRLNTNCSTVLDELLPLKARGIDVTVTVSLDGIGAVHDFVRWPIKWDKFYKNLMAYKAMPVKLNLWTTVSVLNVDDLPNIISFAQEHGIDHSYAYLTTPRELAVENKDTPESLAYIQEQKRLRGIE
jgi:sulfatase maturation enzyme AslB (radical SAM superfamily)